MVRIKSKFSWNWENICESSSNSRIKFTINVLTLGSVYGYLMASIMLMIRICFEFGYKCYRTSFRNSFEVSMFICVSKGWKFVRYAEKSRLQLYDTVSLMSMCFLFTHRRRVLRALNFTCFFSLFGHLRSYGLPCPPRTRLPLWPCLKHKYYSKRMNRPLKKWTLKSFWSQILKMRFSNLAIFYSWNSWSSYQSIKI